MASRDEQLFGLGENLELLRKRAAPEALYASWRSKKLPRTGSVRKAFDNARIAEGAWDGWKGITRGEAIKVPLCSALV